MTTPAQPTVVLPDVSTAPTSAETPSQPAQRSTTATRTTTATRATAPAAATPAESQPVAEAAPAAPLNPQIGDTLNNSPAPQAEVSASNAAPVDAAQPVEDGNGAPIGAIAGVLALLALGAGGVAAMRSRRKSQPEPIAPTTRARVEPELVRSVPDYTPAIAPVAAAPAQAVTYAYAPATATTYAPAADTTYKQAAAPVSQAALPAEQRSERFEMPEGRVPTGEARQQLLREMVAAKPDEANPFRSPSYRRKRARVILQHREYMQREHADQFDWRTYRPATRTSTPVKPSLVDA